jgi:hypothetical protein
VRRLTPLLAVVLIVTAGCGAMPATLSPISSFRLAIDSVLNATDFTLVIKDSGPGGEQPLPAGFTSVMTAVIEKPDKFSMTETVAGQATKTIAIGSIGYFRSAGEGVYWSETHHADESMNWTDSTLLYLNLLRRVKDVIRRGDTYVVPSGEAANLLSSSHFPRLQEMTGVSLSVILKQSGLLETVQLRVSGPSPFSMTATVSKVGSSPNIVAPSRADIA